MTTFTDFCAADYRLTITIFKKITMSCKCRTECGYKYVVTGYRYNILCICRDSGNVILYSNKSNKKIIFISNIIMYIDINFY